MNTPQNNASAGELREAREMARRVIAHHFGNKPGRIVYKASGLSNYVFAVTHNEGDMIVRINFDETKLSTFIKEQWAQRAAREVGVPTASILEVGNEVIGHPFMIARAVDGIEATQDIKNRASILREMGRYAALINTVKTKGYGSTFDWSENRLSLNKTFAEFLEKEMKMDSRLETLEKRKMLDGSQVKALRKVLNEAGSRSGGPHLNHGDMRLKNVMVDGSGAVKAILDWEDSVSNFAPEWELSIALHDLSIDEKQDFLGGYGLSEKKIREIMPLIKAFNVINYAPEIERLAALKETSALEQYRTRLSGLLDLYSA